MLVVGGVWGAVIILIYGDISPVNIDTCLHIFRSGGRPSALAIIVKYLAGPGHRRLPADSRVGNDPLVSLKSRRMPLRLETSRRFVSLLSSTLHLVDA